MITMAELIEPINEDPNPVTEVWKKMGGALVIERTHEVAFV